MGYSFSFIILFSSSQRWEATALADCSVCSINCSSILIGLIQVRVGDRFILQATQKHQKINRGHLQFSHLTGIFKLTCLLKFCSTYYQKAAAGLAAWTLHSCVCWKICFLLSHSRRLTFFSLSPLPLPFFSSAKASSVLTLSMPFFTPQAGNENCAHSHPEVTWLGGEAGPGLLGNLKTAALM